MATNQASAVGSGVALYRMTVKQFGKMIDANVFPDGARVELLGGLLVTMTTNEAHEFIVGQLADLLRPLLTDGWFLREEKSARLGRFWRPEPDIAVVRGRRADFLKRGPRGGDVGLLVEVCDTSYAKDSRTKLRLYASARVPVYWIVNIERRQVEVYSVPTGRGASARYEVTTIHPVTARPGVVLDGQDVGTIAVQELFP